MIHSEDVRSANALLVAIDSFRKLHFGHFGGLTSKIIWRVSRVKKPIKQLI